MKPIKVIKDPQAFQLLADEKRRKIVFLLRVKEMTVSQMAAELNVTPQAVYHHIKKLKNGGLIEVSREVRVDHLIESYYRATAESFICSVGNVAPSREFAKDQARTVLRALEKLGFNLEYDEEKIAELIDLQAQLDRCCSSDEYEDAISELDDVDFLTKQLVQKYVEILSMSDEEYANQLLLDRKVNDLMRTLVKN
jgi:DNA-binding transcriptional ArsR family regulator